MGNETSFISYNKQTVRAPNDGVLIVSINGAVHSMAKWATEVVLRVLRGLLHEKASLEGPIFGGHDFDPDHAR